MLFVETLNRLKIYFPDIRIKYSNYMTTVGKTIYFPSETFIALHPISSTIILFHECIHIDDMNKLGRTLFSFLYLFPQSLMIFSIPLFFINWILGAIFCLLCLLPFPSYFRMIFERRAYIASLYVMHRLNSKLNSGINLDEQTASFIKAFKDCSYYWMFPFRRIDEDFRKALSLIKEGKRPFNDNIFDIIDDCLI
jgi:hypothetical protein